MGYWQVENDVEVVCESDVVYHGGVSLVTVVVFEDDEVSFVEGES